jgi:hypothetical protein
MKIVGPRNSNSADIFGEPGFADLNDVPALWWSSNARATVAHKHLVVGSA